MKTCQTCRIIEKEFHKQKFFYIRLNIVDDSGTGKKSYSVKDVRTELLATKRNRKKAEAMMGSIMDEFNQQCHQANEVYLHVYLNKWLDQKKQMLETTTYEGYVYKSKVIIDYFSEHRIKLPDIMPSDIKDFYQHLLDVEHGEGERHCKGYSNRSIKDISTLLKSCLNEAVILKDINENPARYVKVPYRVEKKEERPYISVSELHCFFGAIKGHRLETAFIIALYYGLRRSEICGLKWSAIHDDGMLYVEFTVTRMKSMVEKDRCKTDASYRSYPIPPQIAEMLQKIRECQARNKRLMGIQYHTTDYIFTWEDGRPYSPDYLTKSFKRIVRSTDSLDDSLTLHSLRASCVSNMVHEGIDIKDIQKWVGHKDINTTLNIYARTNEEQQRMVADRMASKMLDSTIYS